MIYQFKAGSRVHGVDAQTAGQALEALRVYHNGRLDAVDVVEASRDPGAPLHDAFEWADSAAAEMWRREQAKYLIRSVEVVSVVDNDEPKTIRAFVSVRRDEDVSYTSTAHALSDNDLRVQVLAKAWDELEAWRKRHAELVEFAKLFSAIDQARPATKGLKHGRLG